MSNKQHAISDDVLQKIKQGEVHMKPRVYFSLLTGLSVLAVLAASLAVSYVASIVFYWVRIQTASTMAYGARRNLSEALATFPWWYVVAAVVLTALAVILVRKRGTMYRHKASTIALSIIGISLMAGLVLYALGIGSISGPNGANHGAGRQGQGWRQNQ